MHDEVGRGTQVFLMGCAKDIDFIIRAYCKKGSRLSRRVSRPAQIVVVVVVLFCFALFLKITWPATRPGVCSGQEWIKRESVGGIMQSSR